MNKKYSLLVFAFFALLGNSKAQIPAGYYDNASGKSGDDLKIALHNIIKSHTALDYDNLWYQFSVIDNKSTDVVWDIYSDIPGGTPSYTYSFANDQCGQYDSEGDCFNREHSVPQNWFNGDSPMYTDLFHLYPTDGYVNGKRGSYPFGEVSSATWTSSNGSKLGNNTYPGYTGTVFEPIDEYKGDLARTYFYMATCYRNVISGWTSDVFATNDLEYWAINLFYDWSVLDPVNQKEIDRNNGIHDIQGNRNPFIDHPEWIQTAWDALISVDENKANSVKKFWISNGELNYSISSTNNQIEVFSIDGKQILTFQNQASSGNLSFPFSSGVYIVKTSNGETHKVVF